MAFRSLPKPAHLEPSPLSTKEYWDKLYTTEISNHAADPSDVGTIWFDDSAAEDKVLAFLHSPELGLDTAKTSFLDIGTGNGHFLFRLREPWGGDDDSESDCGSDSEDENENSEGKEEQGRRKRRRFTGPVMGIDYSPKSIEFAQRIAQEKLPDPPIEFRRFDIMASPLSAFFSPNLPYSNEKGYDVVLDKGTFDAISLSSEVDDQGREICEGYKERIMPLVKVGGLFLVTSCNWTEAELREWFEGGAGDGETEEFVFVAAVKYKSFRFGGREGQSVSSVCFRKKMKEKKVS